jgi:hypothetical protein
LSQQRSTTSPSGASRSSEPGPGWTEALLDVLWEAHQDELFDATLELWVAARTDPELHEGLIALERGVAQSISRLSAELLADQSDRPGLRDDVEFVLATVRGLALLRIANGENSRAIARRWQAARQRLARLMG